VFCPLNCFNYYFLFYLFRLANDNIKLGTVIGHNTLFAGWTVKKVEDYPWSSPSFLDHTHETSEMEHVLAAYLNTWFST
jgi:hypothetical protein